MKRQLREVEDEAPRAARVGVAHDLDDLLVVRCVELAVERDDAHGRCAAEVLDIDRHRHRSALLGRSVVDRADERELVAPTGTDMMPHRVGHRVGQVEPDAQPSRAGDDRRRAVAAGSGSAVGSKTGRSIEDPDLDPAVAQAPPRARSRRACRRSHGASRCRSPRRRPGRGPRRRASTRRTLRPASRTKARTCASRSTSAAIRSWCAGGSTAVTTRPAAPRCCRRGRSRSTR